MGTRNKLKSIILDNYQMQETTDFENRRDKIQDEIRISFTILFLHN